MIDEPRPPVHPRREPQRSHEPAAPRSRGRRVGRLVGIVGGGACVLAVLAVGVFPTRSFLDQRSDTNQTEQRLAVLRQQNKELADRLEALKTPEEIERLAREQYNLVRPGEEAYSVLPSPLPPVQLPDLWPFGPLGGTGSGASS